MYYSCQIAIQYGLVFSLQIALYRRVKEMIQRFQNRALRVCCLCDRYTSNLELHVQNNVLPIDLRCKMDILNLMYNIAYRNHSNLDPERDERLGPYTRLSAAPTLQCPRPNSSKFLQSISYVGPQMWLNLPAHVRNIQVLHPLKRKSILEFGLNLQVSTESRLSAKKFQ